MKYFRVPLAVLIALMLSASARFATQTSLAFASQDETNQPSQTSQSSALERGFRTGYSDGFSAGSRDVSDNGARAYRNSEDYRRGNRNYNEAWGTAEDYRNGYQQGFEAGYNAGYDRRPFDSSIPAGLTRRDEVEPLAGVQSDNSQQSDPNNSASTNNSGPTNNGQMSGPVAGPISIPRDAVLLVELESSLSTDASQRGDRFQARVVEPREFAGAIVDGRVTRVKRAGKVKGTSELQLEFETIHMPDGNTSGFKADVVELIDMSHRDDSGTVDSEGGVKGRSTTKDDIARVGASTGIGAIIGAVVGGGKGAAIGAAIGGAVGTTSVFTKRGEDVRLERGQQMRIRTATETRLQ
ncbi:MAG TPA: hypothetical protein VGO56_14345 [Pyrinomonadaceae bacterium]|jgi:hypothetical protein|nr:hypothetical protein [Pyrinomonadaceae bacterium]